MKHLFTLLAALGAALVATPASAAVYACDSTAPYNPNYEFTQPVYGVTAIAKYSEYAGGACGAGIANSDTAPQGVTVITDVFAKTNPITRSLLLGVTSDLAGDAPGQQHLVLFTNATFAARAQDIAFGTLFPTSDEDALIAALLSIADGGSDDAGVIFSFAANASRSGPNGDAGFALGDDFVAVAFSNGQIIGTGRSFATPADTGAVPEPATWAMLVGGFGLVGTAMRRRARRPAFA